MPLVPVQGISGKDPASQSTPSLMMSDRNVVMADVVTTPVERRRLTREVRAFGKVQVNETSLATITARVDGYLERLFVDYTGVDVKVGDHLAEIFSPELIDKQVELLVEQNLQTRGHAEARQVRLTRLGMTEQQVVNLLDTKKVSERITLLSPIQGTVIEKLAVLHSSVKAGDVLYRVANLDSVWLSLDIYESELASVRYGQVVEVRAEALAGDPIMGYVWFISPLLNEESRTVKVLVTLGNKKRMLKPGMFVSAILRTEVLSTGNASSTGTEGLWTCPMHPQVLVPVAGECPYCKMSLVQVPVTVPPLTPNDFLVLAVPTTAILDSGTRTVAYVEHKQGEFAAAEVHLGPRAGEFYPVVSGLKEGDRVAIRGNFLIDSQAQISGLPSLFQQDGAGASSSAETSTPVTFEKTQGTAAPSTAHRH